MDIHNTKITFHRNLNDDVSNGGFEPPIHVPSYDPTILEHVSNSTISVVENF